MAKRGNKLNTKKLIMSFLVTVILMTVALRFSGKANENINRNEDGDCLVTINEKMKIPERVYEALMKDTAWEFGLFETLKGARNCVMKE